MWVVFSVVFSCQCTCSHLMLPQRSSQHRTTFLLSSSSLRFTLTNRKSFRGRPRPHRRASQLAHVMPRDLRSVACACPQCLPSDIVPVRSWTQTLRPPGVRHRHLPCHGCATVDATSGYNTSTILVVFYLPLVLVVLMAGQQFAGSVQGGGAVIGAWHGMVEVCGLGFTSSLSLVFFVYHLVPPLEHLRILVRHFSYNCDATGNARGCRHLVWTSLGIFLSTSSFFDHCNQSSP